MFPPRRSDPDLASLLKRADDLLAGGDVSADVPAPPPPAPKPSLWQRIKSVANYSPLPEDIGEQFARDVDPTEARDKAALEGTYGWRDKVKSFLAGAGGGFLSTLRSAATPAGIGAMVSGEGAIPRLVAGAAGTVLAGEGAETLADPNATVAQKVLAVPQLAGGLAAGVHAIPERVPPPRPRIVTEPTLAPHPAPPAEPIPVSTLPEGAGARTILADTLDYTPLKKVLGMEEAVPPPVESPAAPKPKITAEEFAGILRGREKFAAQNPDAALPPGARDELDRLGLEYGRTQGEYKRLKALLEGGGTLSEQEAADYPRYSHAARELGARVRKGAKEVVPPLITPPAETSLSTPPVIRQNRNVSSFDSLARLLDRDKISELRQAAEDSLASVSDNTRNRGGGRTGIDWPRFQQWVLGSDADTISNSAEWQNLLREGREAISGGRPESAPEQPRNAHSKAQEDLLRKKEAEARASDPWEAAQDAHMAANREQTRAMSQGVMSARTPASGGGGGEPIASPAVPDRFTQEYGLPSRPDPTSERGALNLEALRISDPRPAIAATLDKANPKAISDLANQYQVASLVGAPTTVANIGVSNIGSMLQIAAEKAAETRSLTPLTSAVRELNPISLGRDFIENIKHPTQIPRYTDSPALESPFGKLLQYVTRPIGAADATFKEAAARAGFSPEDALRITQQQRPSTQVGREVLSLQQRNPLVKFAQPIMKAPINLAEQGLVEPAKSLNRIVRGEETPADYVKVLFAAGAAAGYYSASDSLDSLPPWARRLALASAGLYSVPAAIGYAVGDAQGGKGLAMGLQELQRSIPGLEGFALTPTSLLNRVIPRGLQQLNPDYWAGTKRKTGNVIDMIKARIPGAAQTLPEQPQRPPAAKRARQARQR